MDGILKTVITKETRVILEFELQDGSLVKADIPDITKLQNETWKYVGQESSIGREFSGLQIKGSQVLGSSDIRFIADGVRDGELTKVDPVKVSHSKRNGSTAFQRIYFKMADGSWAKTDLCPGFRNYARWKKVIEAGVGTKLTGLIKKNDDTVDADSMVRIIN